MGSSHMADDVMSSVTDICVLNSSGNFTDDYVTIAPYRVMSTDVHQSNENVTDSDKIAADESSNLLFVVLTFKWILSPFVVTADC